MARDDVGLWALGRSWEGLDHLRRKNQAYAAALAKLRERYRMEFDRLYAKERTRLGLPPINVNQRR